MKSRTAIVIMFALTAACLVYAAIISPHLPETVPVHWNIHGKADNFGPKWMDLYLMPGVMAGIIGLYFVLPALSPKQFKIEPFQDTYNEILTLIVGLFAYIHVVLIQTVLHPHFDIGKILVAGMMLFMAALGNFMGKVRRNFWMGIRTPWTLASDAVWVATHRLAGRLMVAAGILGAVAALLGAPVIWIIILLVASMLYPVVHSFILYKRLEEPDST